MFVRIKSSVQGGRTYEYVQLVESRREGKAVRQRVVANLGRLDAIRENGSLDRIVRSLAKHSQRLRVLEMVESAGFRACQAKTWGPALVFGRLWQEQGIPEVIEKLARGRKFEFSPERVCFALALQRLSACPGSDLQGSAWVKTVEAEGLDQIELQHFYRTVRWLGEIREDLERELFFKDRDLFSRELELTFIDTTSTYIYRDQETAYAKRGYSRDLRPDLPQMVICLATDKDRWPVSWEIFPGDTADKKALTAVIAKFRKRFAIKKVSIVADRGMISRNTIELLKNNNAPFDYILGCRLRKQKEVSEEVLSRGGRYQEVDDSLKVKEVFVEGRRYIVCRNDDEAKRDAAARLAIVEQLQEKLAGGAKSLVGNAGYRRFLKGEKGSFRIDFDAVKRDARFDGVYVLHTSLDLPAAEIAKTYKGLWRVERLFREEKSTLHVRPLFHHRDDTRMGHIVGSFLALRLEVDLQNRLKTAKTEVPWPDLMRDLGQLQAIYLNLDDKGYKVRTDLTGSAFQAFQAAGIRVPPKVTELRSPPNPTQAEQQFCSA